jgi:TfoX/Sxy family transcriptional regulator of competence genes
MATQQRTIAHLIEQATGAGSVSAEPMFGEYGLYVDGKMIGSVCDDQLFVKPTASGRVHAEPVSDAPPNPDAKPQMMETSSGSSSAPIPTSALNHSRLRRSD